MTEKWQVYLAVLGEIQKFLKPAGTLFRHPSFGCARTGQQDVRAYTGNHTLGGLL